jgi:Zn-dependent oligopeptidase
MKSNETTPFDSLPNEQKELMSKMMVAKSVETVEKTIDDFTSANLKRVLKILSHVHFANAILERDNPNLEEKEQNLIDYIFNLHETVLGHQALLNEIKGEQENPENSGLEQTSLETSLEENINE